MSVHPPETRLPQRLAGLKRHGSRILVVGDTGQQRLCERFAGSPSARRQCLLVTPETPDHECQHTTGVDSVVTADAEPRPVDAPGFGADSAMSTRLSSLAADTVHRIDALASDGLGPSELRVCIGPLTSLLDIAPRKQVSLFLDAVLDRAEAARGLAHVHCQRPYDSDTVRRLEPRFDAVVEARSTPTPCQRWHVPEDDLTTDWLPIQD